MKLFEMFKMYPARTMAVATVILGWLSLMDVPAEVVAGIGTILGIVLAVPVHNAVTPVGAAAEMAATAASDAASETAASLSTMDVGAAGELTQGAATVAANSAVLAVTSALVANGYKANEIETAVDTVADKSQSAPAMP